MANVQAEVKRGITPIIVMFAFLLIAGFTAMASIEETIKAGVISASALVELYLFLYMLDRV